MLQPPRIRRVAIIGAGPGGLAAARALRDEGAFDTITVFECNSKLGGIWRYSEKAASPSPIPSTNALLVNPASQTGSFGPVISPIYENARTNLPKTLMAYRDIPFADNTIMFPERSHVLSYIERVAKDCDLLPMIRFNTTVVNVEFCSDATWQVCVNEQTENKTDSYTELFDAVIVASGHHYVPYLPDMKGIREYASHHHVMHALEYRHPQVFSDKTVLIIGKGNSAFDLVQEISAKAKKVYHCVRDEDSPFSLIIANNMPKNTERVGGIIAFHDNEIECEHGTMISDGVDTVLFATGYLYSYPFLPFESDLIVDGQKVHKLYEHLFYVENPTLTFLGLPIRVAQFPLMQLQSTVIARCYSGKVQMPSQQVMRAAIAGETNDRNSFVMGAETELAYLDRLGAWAEGYEGNMEEWNSTNPLTGRLPEEWREIRKLNSVNLLQEFLRSRLT